MKLSNTLYLNQCQQQQHGGFEIIHNYNMAWHTCTAVLVWMCENADFENWMAMYLMFVCCYTNSDNYNHIIVHLHSYLESRFFVYSLRKIILTGLGSFLRNDCNIKYHQEYLGKVRKGAKSNAKTHRLKVQYTLFKSDKIGMFQA